MANQLCEEDGERTAENKQSQNDLLELVSWLERNPKDHLYMPSMQVSCYVADDFGRVARSFGSFRKEVIGGHIYLYHTLTPTLQLFVAHRRDLVCTRKQVGTKTVTIPAKPATEEKTEEVPVYEWDCGSVLEATK